MFGLTCSFPVTGKGGTRTIHEANMTFITFGLTDNAAELIKEDSPRQLFFSVR